MPRRGERKWGHLLEDERVGRWYENLARRNKSSADIYVRQLARELHAFNGSAPGDLLDLDQAALEDVVSDCIAHQLDAKELKGPTVGRFEVAVKSFLEWHGRELKRSNNIPGRSDHDSTEEEQIPSQDDLGLVFAASNLRTAAALSFVAFGGLRPQVLGRIDASDGLRLRDLPDLRYDENRAWFETVPAKVEVSKALSKTRKAFFTFLGPEGCKYVAAYLGWRIQRGEALTPDSPVIVPHGGAPRFCLRNNICDSIRRAMRSAGLSQRPYVWRAYFGNRCMMAESKGLLASWRRFFMGHKGDIQTRYALRKRLQKDTEDQMRHAYEQACTYLEAGRQASQDPTLHMASLLLRVQGWSDDEIRDLHLEEKAEEEIAELLAGAMKSEPEEEAPAQPRQRIIPLAELESALGTGWMFKAALPGDKAVVEAA